MNHQILKKNLNFIFLGNKIFILFFLFFSYSLLAQGPGNYYLRTNAIVSVTSCAGFIYDSGGPTGNYSDNSDSRIEIFSGQPGFMVSISGSIWLETGDTLFIYDGADINGTILFKGTSPSDGVLRTIAPVTSTTGPLTVRFKTDASGNDQGVELMITCIDQNDYSGDDPNAPTDTAACIDFTNLTGSHVTCYYGTFANPYSNIGIQPGRHRIKTDVNEKDPYTNGQLYCVCPGETASVLLGDNINGANAEAIMYEYFVDTSNYDILVLKYAAVLQAPGHGPTKDPRFEFVILDQHNNAIDPTCGAAEFQAGHNTIGWNTGTSNTVWKNWTTVGIDISNYHNQIIRIRFTTYDCSPTAHFGYAYFSLSCKKRKITVESCGNIQQNTYTAPDGFNYRWYYQDAPGTTLSTNQTYSASVDFSNRLLLCDVSFIDNASCKFTLYVQVRPRFPLADFTYRRVGCSNTIYLTNTSLTSADGVTPDGTGQWCESAYWDFGNGTTSNLYSPTAVTYANPGTYTITMVAGLSNNQCLDTIQKTITLYPNIIEINGDTNICQGDSTTLTVAQADYVFWNTGESGLSITVAPESDRTYTVASTTADGCYATGQFTVHVHPRYFSEITHTIYNNQPYFFNGQWINSAGVYYQHLQTASGCDSTIKLVLHHYVEEEVNICSPDVYNFRGRILTESGTYTDSIRLSGEADSVYRIKLSINPTYLSSTDHNMCDNESFIWHDTTFSNVPAGIYYIYDTLQTINGCDSIFYLRLVVKPTIRMYVYDTICQGQTFRFLTYTFTEEGVHYVNRVQSNGCDIVTEVHLKVYPTYLIHDTVQICFNQTYNFRGKIVNQPGIYYDSLISSKGCDSVYKLTLIVNPIYLFQSQTTICDNQTYNFRGRILNQGGIYYDSLTSSLGCDSVYELTLTVNPTYLIQNQANICDNQIYNFRGKTLNQAGIYYDSLTSSLGCDSVYELTLTVSPTYLIQNQATICDNQTYNFRGRILNQAGVYYDSLTSSLGCDSVYEITLTVNPTYLIQNQATICNDQNYNFRGKILSQAGVYYDSLTSSLGCDSVYELTLTFNPIYLIQNQATICDNQIYNFRGQILNQAGIYYDSLTSSLGCDSVYELTLTVSPTYLIQNQATICDNQTYNFRGRILNQAGVYYDSLTSSLGCDSVYEITLTVNPTYLIQNQATICDDQNYNFRGRILNQAGVYYDSLTSSLGCDSVYQLTLIVNPTYLIQNQATICDDQNYNFRGQIINQAGVYYDSLTSSLGCDSVYELTLMVNSTYLIQNQATICDNQTYNFRGRILNQAGVYYDSLTSSLGCDSVYEITLTVNSTYLIQNQATICDNQTYNFRGRILNQAGIYYDSLTSSLGCDSVYQLTLIVNPTYLLQNQATICDNQNYNFRGRILSQAGVYYDSLISSLGCDSVYELTLTVNPTYLIQNQATICDNQNYNFRGRILNQAGVYYDSLTSSLGCDSVYEITLTVNSTYLIQSQATICDNQTYNFRGQTIYQPGVYYDSLISSLGCDSVYELTLIVNPTYFYTATASIPDNTTYNFNRQIISLPGLYYDSLLSSMGCDSIFELELKINPTYLFENYATICDNQTYNFRGQIIYQPGIYYDSLTSSLGCDSVYQLTLFVNPTYIFKDSATICDNQTYNFRGQIIYQPGIYYDSLISSLGCDSIYLFKLFVNPTYLFPDSATICDNQNYNFRGQIINQPGIYYDSLISSLGCDSIYQLQLFVNPTYLFPNSATICDNQNYNFRGQTINQPGIYYDSLTSSLGCDSVYQLELFINPTYLFPNSATICDNQTYNFRGQIINQPGIYYDSLSSSLGCDSVYQLQLFVNPTYIFPDSATICDNQAYNFRGLTIFQPGIYYDSLISSLGCDSVYQLELFVNPTFLQHDTIAIPDNQTYNFRGQIINQPGIYYDSLISSLGCDSVYQLTLWVNPTYLFPDSATICDDQNYNFRGQIINQPGVYYDSLISSLGCDSVYQLQLFVNPTYLFLDSTTICDNQNYNFRGQTINQPGIYYDSLTSSLGCDSVYLFKLFVNPTYLFPDSATICDNQNYNFRGQTINQPGIYYDSLISSLGCDSVYQLQLFVNPTYLFPDSATICDNQTYNFRGQTINQPGIYYDSLTSSLGCDSVYQLQLFINPTYLFPDSATICDNQNYNFREQIINQPGIYYDSLTSSLGCDSVYQFQLFVNPTYIFPNSATICDNQTYNFRGQTINQPGIYYDSLTSSLGCDSVYVLTLIVNPTYIFPDNATICDNQNYNFRGQIINQPGVYYDSLISSLGCDSVYQLQLFVSSTHIFTDSATICDNQNYNFRGQIINQPGIYYDSLISSLGCDSIFQFKLFLNPTYLFTDSATICDNQNYNFRGHTINQPGIYYDSLTSSLGCDSVYQLQLFVNPTYLFPNSVTICDNQTYNFRGQTINQPGIYYDSLTSSLGCDSVYQLQLFVSPTYIFTDSATICDNQTYNFRGQTIYQPGIYYDSLTSSLGCDSIFQFKLFVNPTDSTWLTAEICQGDSYVDSLNNFFIYQDSTQQSGEFYYSHTVSNSFGCDSMVILELIIHPTHSLFFSDTICQGNPYYDLGFNIPSLDSSGEQHFSLNLFSQSGCDSTINLNLFVKKSYNLQFDTSACRGYPFSGYGFIVDKLEESGPQIYTKELITYDGCDSIVTLNIEVLDRRVTIESIGGDFCEDGSVVLLANTDLPNILWSTGETSEMITIEQAGRYMVSVFHGECHAEDMIVFEPCHLDIFVPSAFTPSNNDGLNDFFSIALPPNHQIIEFEIVIYNRWGEAVFQSKDYNFKWDGKVNGKIIVNQLYTYKIVTTTQFGLDYIFKGTITVL